jgi:two-component system NtrC family sensor kinase
MVRDLPVPWLTERETAALIVVALSLLFFRALREDYLLVWGAGWLAYGSCLFLERLGELPHQSIIIAWGTHASFILALGLMAGAALVSAKSWRVMTACGLVTSGLLMLAPLQPFYFPESNSARLALEVACRLVAAVAAFELIRSRSGRVGLGPWMFAGLPLLNAAWPPFTRLLSFEESLLAEVLMSSSLFLVALDDSRSRTRRLAVLNQLTDNIARRQNLAPMMQVTLEKLANAIGAKAAWFRLMDHDNLIPTQHVGLSPDFMRAIGQVAMDENLALALRSKCALVVRVSQTPGPVRDQLRRRGIHQIILVPVLGKEAAIGVLCLGCRRFWRQTSEELKFLETAAQKIGMAAENLRLLERVLRSDNQWMSTFDSIQDLILVHDTEGRVLKMNRALQARLEKPTEEVLGKPCEAVLPHTHAWRVCPYCDRGSGLTEGLDRCLGGRSVVSTSSYLEHGSRQEGTIHVIHDTTDSHAAEEKYRRLFEQAQEGMFVATLDGDLLDCNHAFVTMLGYGSRDELMALDLAGILGANEEERNAFRKELEAHNYVRSFEMTMHRKDGACLTVAQSCFATRDANNEVERYQGFVLDITEKKRSEEDMRRRNRELNALNAMAIIATQSFDLDEILNLTLRQVISLFGAETGSIYLVAEQPETFRRRAGWGPRSESRARQSEVRFPEGLGDLLLRSRAEVVTHDFLPHLSPAVVEFVCADRLPYWIWVLLWGNDKPIGMMGIAGRDGQRCSSTDENLLVAIGRQLATTIEKVQLYEETSRAYENLRRTQEQLLQSEKMSAVGQLISGVAHELNNPLTAILGYAQLLEGFRLEQRASDYVAKLFKQAQRTQRVVQNLLSFARQRRTEKQPVDLRKVLEETIGLREYDLKMSGIIVERDFPDEIPLLIGDPHQLEQVFLNIVNNAVDAMREVGDKGVLTVRLRKKEAFVCVEFADTGPGIKDAARIFDPFYTTKSIGKGTGLGLSICYGIVKEHNGEIVARNRPEGGASIEVLLPANEQAPLPEFTSAPHRETVLKGRILLVEVEEAVLEFERDVLMGAGAEVTTCLSFDEVKATLQKGAFDVAVVNGRLPGGLGAEEIYEWFVANQPGTEHGLLFTFSSEANPSTQEFLQKHNIPSLTKPFEIADLIAHVRPLLQPAKAAPIDNNASAAHASL